MMEQFAKIFLVAAFLITISSCERQNCKNVVCPIDQTCNNGQCFCYDGYEGTDCQTLSYDKYVGSYNFVSESCTPPTPFTTSNVFIQHGSSQVNSIEIYNLMGGFCVYVTAYIATDNNNKGNILTIPEQSSNCSGNIISGQGTFNEGNNTINLQLYYTFGGTSYTCTSTLYR